MTPTSDVEGPLAELAEDRHPLEGVELGVEPLAVFRPCSFEEAGEVLGEPLGQGRDEDRAPPCSTRFRASISKRGDLAPGGLDADEGVEEAGGPDDLLDDLAAGHRGLVVGRASR